MEINSFKIRDFNSICNIFCSVLQDHPMTEQELNISLKNTLSGGGSHTYCFFDNGQLIGFVILAPGKLFYEKKYKTVIDFIYLPESHCNANNLNQIMNVINTWADEKHYEGLCVGNTAFLQPAIKTILFDMQTFNAIETVWETV